MEDNLTKEEAKRYNQIVLYTDSFDSNELNEFENKIFGNLTKKQRLSMELRRIKEYLKNNSDVYAKYLDEIIELEKQIKLLNFDETLTEKIYVSIVNIQLDVKQSIRLFSIIPKIKENLEYMKFYRNQLKKNNLKIKR